MLFIQETYVNRTEDYIFGQTDVEKAWTDDVGKLFRSLQREYGRCIGHVHVDTTDETVRTVGWVFEKRMKYEDSNETYLQETWVTLYKEPPRLIMGDLYDLKKSA